MAFGNSSGMNYSWNVRARDCTGTRNDASLYFKVFAKRYDVREGHAEVEQFQYTTCTMSQGHVG